MNVVVDCGEELLCCVCNHRLGLYVVVRCLVSVLNADWSEEWATIHNIVLAIMRNVEKDVRYFLADTLGCFIKL